MIRRSLAVAAATALALVGLGAPVASAHRGDPHYDSVLAGGGIPGVEVQVLNYGDRLLVHNRSRETVLIEGYEGEPYARLQPSGRVQINTRSPAAYLNATPTADATVPATADAEATPVWRTVSGDGRFEFHDHRIHWMSPGVVPRQVRDRDARTKVFSWSVPIRVGSTPTAIHGTLFWRGSEGGPPTGAFLGFGGLLLGCLGLVAVVRRRRGRTGLRGEPAIATESW